MSIDSKKAIKREKNTKLLKSLENKDLNAIVKIMNPFINMIANKIHYSSHGIVEVNDLISNGYIGLLDAISKFNIDKSQNLKSYAEIRIKGAMLDYTRSQDKLPRSMRDKVNLIKKTISKLEGKLGRKVTDLEVSNDLSFDTIEEYYKYLTSIKRAFYVNLKDFYPNSDKDYELNDEKQQTPEKNYENKLRNKYLNNKIAKLNIKQRKVIEMHYLQEMNLKEISNAMKLTESRISQLHLAALKVLKNELNSEIIQLAN
jgi:RNA polymerase sigma factor for flagellar operon FliA